MGNGGNGITGGLGDLIYLWLLYRLQGSISSS